VAYNDNQCNDRSAGYINKNIGAGFGSLRDKWLIFQAGEQTKPLEIEIGDCRPGNNWKAVASTRNLNGWVDGVHLAADGQTFVDANFEPVPAQCISPMLTVWRTLRVELDSMGEEFVTGESFSLGAARKDVYDDLVWEDDQFNDFGEDWDLNANTNNANPVWLRVTRTAGPVAGISGVGTDTAWPAGYAQVGDWYKIKFVSWADDDLYRGDIPDPEVGELEAAYGEAYILPDFTIDEQYAPWHYNFGNNVLELTPFLRAHRGQTVNEAQFWSVYLMATYEVPDEARDNDPPEERVTSV
jgi:hypothetical protein